MYGSKNVGKMKLFEVHVPEAMRAFVAFDKAALAEGKPLKEVQGADCTRRHVHDSVPLLHRDPCE